MREDQRDQYGDYEAQLSDLLAAYRDAIPDPEPSAAFMPSVWAKIEARRTFVHDLKRLAQGVATAAAAVSLLLALFFANPQQQPTYYTTTYVETLAADEEQDNPEVVLLADYGLDRIR